MGCVVKVYENVNERVVISGEKEQNFKCKSISIFAPTRSIFHFIEYHKF